MAATWHNGTPGLIVASGEIDLGVAEDFEAALIAEGGAVGVLCVDLAEVTFFDSTALHALINAKTAVGRIVLRRPPQPVLRVLDVTGMTELFEIDA